MVAGMYCCEVVVDIAFSTAISQGADLYNALQHPLSD